MIAEKIRSIIPALGNLAGKVSEEDWLMLRNARKELEDAADTAEALESNLVAPRAESEHKTPLLMLVGSNKEAACAQA